MPFQPGSRWMEVLPRDGVTIIKFTQHHILDEGPILTLGEHLTELVAKADRPFFALDFDMVSRLSSSFLVQLIHFHHKVKAAGGRIAFYGIGPDVFTVFEVTRLHDLFRIFTFEHEALADLKADESDCPQAAI